MRKRMLLITLAIAVMVLGLSTANFVAAEQSTAEPATVSSDKPEPGSSSVTAAPVGTDSDSELKRGRIGGGGARPAMRPAARPAARPMARPAGHIARPAGHAARPAAHHGPRPAHPGARIAHHPGHHHPGHHPGHHHHPVGVVSWGEFGRVPGYTEEPVYVETETEVTLRPRRNPRMSRPRPRRKRNPW